MAGVRKLLKMFSSPFRLSDPIAADSPYAYEETSEHPQRQRVQRDRLQRQPHALAGSAGSGGNSRNGSQGRPGRRRPGQGWKVKPHSGRTHRRSGSTGRVSQGSGTGPGWHRSLSLGSIGKRSKLHTIRDLEFVIDILQEDRWVLTHTAQGVGAQRPVHHFFDVVAGLPLMQGLPHTYLPSRRPRVPTDFAVPEEWREKLSLSCVVSSTALAAPGRGASSGNRPAEASTAAAARWRSSSTGGIPRSQAEAEAEDPTCGSIFGLSGDLTAGPDRVWYVPARGSSFPASYCIQFRSQLALPGILKPDEEDLVVTLEMRRAPDNVLMPMLASLQTPLGVDTTGGTVDWWHAVRISVQVAKPGAPLATLAGPLSTWPVDLATPLSGAGSLVGLGGNSSTEGSNSNSNSNSSRQRLSSESRLARSGNTAQRSVPAPVQHWRSRSTPAQDEEPEEEELSEPLEHRLTRVREEDRMARPESNLQKKVAP